MKKVLTAALAGAFILSACLAYAAEPVSKTVLQVHQEKQALAGQMVQVQGKVVKVNNGIMKRNFVHVQDGTGDPSSNDLVITSQQTAKVGDSVVIVGKVVLDRDFSSGYSYPLLIEESTIAPGK